MFFTLNWFGLFELLHTLIKIIWGLLKLLLPPQWYLGRLYAISESISTKFTERSPRPLQACIFNLPREFPSRRLCSIKYIKCTNLILAFALSFLFFRESVCCYQNSNAAIVVCSAISPSTSPPVLRRGIWKDPMQTVI